MPEGWLEGKPVTPLIRQLMHHARDQDVIVPDGADHPTVGLARMHARWRSHVHIVQLTPLGRKVLDGEI